ncbi:MAG: hypothetical protein HFH91_03250 [Lachnospiraceae bacterium]|nr:hypothetical protein [Lachnospiraceae bacterium]
MKKVAERDNLKLSRFSIEKILKIKKAILANRKIPARLAELIQILLKEKKYKEIQAVSESWAKRHEMYGQYGI